MNRYIGLAFASAVSIGALGSAMAADLPMKAPPIMAPVDYWSGFYIGGNGGYGWDKVKSTELAPGTNAFPTGTVFNTSNGTGWTAGVQAGYNWLLAPHFLFGVEGEYSWANINGSDTTVSTVPRLLGFTSYSTSNLKDFALGTARVGYVEANWLFYAKAGAAWGEANGTGIATAANGTLFETSTHFVSRSGYVVGVGGEWSFAPNWSARIEYDHIFFDARTVSITGTVDTSFSSSGSNVDLVRAGINYRFNWGGAPLVAKY